MGEKTQLDQGIVVVIDRDQDVMLVRNLSLRPVKLRVQGEPVGILPSEPLSGFPGLVLRGLVRKFKQLGR
ncbi:MAG TPA: hypothetical protein VD932_02485 [Aquabacterium sp.]|nr:hypothetical protein [Aquabacterium sp.]